MLLPRLPVLSALLVLLLAAGRCTAAAALLRGSGTRMDGRLDGRSMLEQVGRYPRSRTEPATELTGHGVRTPGPDGHPKDPRHKEKFIKHLTESNATLGVYSSQSGSAPNIRLKIKSFSSPLGIVRLPESWITPDELHGSEKTLFIPGVRCRAESGGINTQSFFKFCCNSPSGPLYFNPKCRKHFHRLYHNTRDCTIPAYFKRCARLLTRLANSPRCTER